MNTDSALEVQGIVQRHPVAELLVEIGEAGLDGSLRVSNRERKTVVYFDSGKVVFAASNAREHRLFAILLADGSISERDLVEIEDYVNDLKLASALVRNGKLSRGESEQVFARQISAAIGDVAQWREGNWIFSTLARIKEDLRFTVNLNALMHSSACLLSEHEVLGRFKSYDETFRLAESAQDIAIELEPREAFLLSRIDSNPLTISQIKALSGLEGNEVLSLLYGLWLGGYLVRDNWNRAFKPDVLRRIGKAKLTLSRAASSVEEEERKKDEEARKAAEAEARKLAELEERQNAADERKRRDKLNRDAGFREVKMALDDYLEKVENAPTYYELFGIAPDAKPATVKRAYFSFARRFHPDVFQKKVDAEKHRQIQKAFTELARAYETLRNEDTRELYDLRLGKVLEALKKYDGEDISGLTREDIDAEQRSGSARENFERGMRLFSDGSFEEAVAYFGRAAQLDAGNAEFRAFYGAALSKEKRGRHKAETELLEAVSLAPGDSRFRLMLAELYVEIGLSVRATNEIRKLLSVDPGNVRAKELLNSLGTS